jgi:hypothetical protein
LESGLEQVIVVHDLAGPLEPRPARIDTVNPLQARLQLRQATIELSSSSQGGDITPPPLNL